MNKKSDAKHSSRRLFFIVIGVLALSAIGVAFFRYKNPKAVSQPPSPYTVTPSNIITGPGVVQSFTVTYADTTGWENISDASLIIAGGKHDQWLHYSPATNSFSFDMVNGSCAPGQTAALSSSFLTLNCRESNASGSGAKPTVTFSLTPKPSFSGMQYRLAIIVSHQAGPPQYGVLGTWTVK